jgi:hypothetical protein
MKKLALCVLLATTSSVVMAENYIEVDFSFIDREAFGEDTDASIFNGKYYFDAIDNTKGPLAEAGFLTKSSEVSLTYGTASREDSANDRTMGIAGRYVSDDGVIVGVNYINAGYNDLSTKYNYGYNTDTILDSGYLEVGKYLTDYSSLTLSYSTNQNDDEGDKYRSNTMAVRYNHLFLMEGDTSIKLSAKYGYTEFDDYEDDDNDYDDYSRGHSNIFDVHGDYYFNRQLNVGLGLSTYKTTYSDTVIKYKLNTNYYINDNISVYASYAFADFDQESTDPDDVSTIIAGFNVRF